MPVGQDIFTQVKRNERFDTIGRMRKKIDGDYSLIKKGYFFWRNCIKIKLMFLVELFDFVKHCHLWVSVRLELA